MMIMGNIAKLLRLKMNVLRQIEMENLRKKKGFTFAVIEKLLREDRYVKHSSVLSLYILLLMRHQEGET